MIVVCISDLKSLIKGKQYQSDALDNRRISIKDLGFYDKKHFKTLDGKDLPNTTFNNRKSYRLNIDDLKKGDVLICITDKYKTYVESGKYKIEYIETKIKKELDRFKNVFSYDSYYIKFEGINTKLKFSHNTKYSFRKYTNQEHRDVKINSLIHNKKEEFVDSSKRNIESVNDKDDYLLKILASSIIDKKRHHLSIVDWAVKIGTNLQIENSDFDKYMDMKLSDILNKIK